jgi:hypothetical protein
VSTSVPTVNIWCAHTTNPSSPIASIAKIIPKFPKTSFPFLKNRGNFTFYFYQSMPLKYN